MFNNLYLSIAYKKLNQIRDTQGTINIKKSAFAPFLVDLKVVDERTLSERYKRKKESIDSGLVSRECPTKRKRLTR